MLTTQTFTADASKLIGTVHRRSMAPHYVGTIIAYGTWGSGTITYYLSPNGGTTKVPLKDLTGTTVTSTADDNVNVQLGNSNVNSTELSVWATLAGATNPSLTVSMYDNR